MLGVKCQENNEHFTTSFKNVLIDMAQMLGSVGCDITEQNGDSVETNALKRILMRHRQPLKRKSCFKRYALIV